MSLAIPSVQDWLNDPAAASAMITALVQQTDADAANTPAVEAESVAGEVLIDAAPLVGALATANPVTAPEAPLIATGLSAIGTELENQHAGALQSLSPTTQAVTQGLINGALAIASTKVPQTFIHP